MIFAQKPNATACADYDLWNKQMGRYVRRGSKGIALIDTTGDNPRLKYVFDVSDTGGRDNSRRLNLWEYKDEHQDAVTTSLENRFGVSGEKGLADQLEQIASKLVTEYWNDNRRDILGILADSFLEEYDDYNVEVAFRNAATVSTTYTLMSRCGLNPADYFEHEDFLSVFDFNTRDTIAVLGSAVSNSSEQILRQIAITVKNYPIMQKALRNMEAAGGKLACGHVNARSDAAWIDAAIRSQKQKNANLNLTWFEGRSVVPEDMPVHGGTHHVSTWVKAYDIKALREWLFEQRLR